MVKNINYIKIEKKWREIWSNSQLFFLNQNSKKKKYYVLSMFLYPSGNIHIGHVRNYAIGDTIARYKKSQGFNILHPMGWDAFGLPAENAAIQNKLHPNDWTLKNIKEMKKQLYALGFAYNWDREINTSDSAYYKHEQAIFIDLFKANLAYQKESIVNWDPIDCTVLANEQVIDGRGWRSGAIIQKKKLKQWFLKVTKYAHELLNDLEYLPNWPNKVKNMQKNWIGKINGAYISCKIHDSNARITIFSPKPALIFGSTFICISYKHFFAKKYFNLFEQNNYSRQSKLDFIKNNNIKCIEKIGFFTKYYAYHPYIKTRKLPIFISNYISSYNNFEAIFCHPAHDNHDYEFAIKYNLNIFQVIVDSQKLNNCLPFSSTTGTIINSYFLDNLSLKNSKFKIAQKLKSDSIGVLKDIFKIEDWGISRQRYWGCPIPIIYCKKCGSLPELKSNLPIKLPQDIVLNKSNNPLQNHLVWKRTRCYKCGCNATRETDTFDTFFESSWYFLRFCSLEKYAAFDGKIVEKWLPVSQYVGGIEHAILHLLYARFFIKVLRDCKYIDFNEPFQGLVTQGMVFHRTFRDQNHNWLSPDQVFKKNGKWITKNDRKTVYIGELEKMSKSKKNTINPNNIIQKYGVDSIRLFLLSDSPLNKDLEWSDKGIEGCYKYLLLLYRMICDFYHNKKEHYDFFYTKKINFEKIIQQSIYLITLNLESFSFNKAIANIRKLTNKFVSNNYLHSIKEKHLVSLVKIISVFAPYIAEELYSMLGQDSSSYIDNWPSLYKDLLINNLIKMPMQINGKMKMMLELPIDCNKDFVLNNIKSIKVFDKYLSNINIKNIFFIQNKIINFII